ncbi:hypothetical protein HPP92_026569 [Vanilla planifolia]|uniref:Uncharacterized protein n=1 Tax=Vanilla planifolia TaxID=51239 RepID=A0A835PCH2_VANPL|nr:hypothetical protein HPP92_026569 [Vanilla planifolia]
MDPSIVKFFEDDEDESMHSGADVEAFSAALTRDIGGEPSTSTHQPHHSDVGTDCQGSSSSASQKLPEQWETSTQDDAGQGSISVPKPLLEGMAAVKMEMLDN